MSKARLILPHSSSVVGTGIWAAALFVLSLRRSVDDDLMHLGWRAWLVIASLCLFVLIVAGVQRWMGLPVSALRFRDPGHLVVSGPFRFTRNPIYLSALLPLAGLAGYSLHIAMASAVVYVFATTKWVIGPEEQRLRALFGRAHTDHAARTPRWLGF